MSTPDIFSRTDFINAAKLKGIQLAPEEVVLPEVCCICIRITNVDPLKYNLLFERFQTPHVNQCQILMLISPMISAVKLLIT